MDFDTDGSLLVTFVGIASDPDTAETVVLKCGKEKWTYSELHTISSGIALDMGRRYGLRPVVAVVSDVVDCPGPLVCAAVDVVFTGQRRSS